MKKCIVGMLFTCTIIIFIITDQSMERVGSSPQLNAADKGQSSSGSHTSSPSPRSMGSPRGLMVPDSGLTNKASKCVTV